MKIDVPINIAYGIDTYTVSLNPTWIIYQTNQIFYVKFINSNTGASTLNINGLGAVQIFKNGTDSLDSGDISADQIVQCIYDGTNIQIIGTVGSSNNSLPTINNVGDILTTLDGSTWVADEIIYDQSAVESIYPNNRMLIDSLGGGSVNWDNGSLIDSAGTTVVNWRAFLLHDSSSGTSLDWDSRLLYDTLGTQSVDWGNRVLVASNGASSATWEGMQLINKFNHFPVVDWGNLRLTDNSNIWSVDWAFRLLKDAAAITSVDWTNRYLKSSSGAYAMDWENRGLYDSSSVQSIDFGLRRTYDTAAHSVFSWATEFRTHRLDGTNNSYASNKRSYKHEYQASLWDGAVAVDKYFTAWHDVSVGANKSWLKWTDTSGAEAMRLEDGGSLYLSGLHLGATEEELNFNTVQNALKSSANSIQQFLVGTIFTKTSDTTVANTVVETNILGTGIGSLTIGADNLKVGKTIAIKVSGFHSSAGNPDLTVRVRLGGTLIASGTITCGNGTNAGFNIQAEITCRSIGVAGTVSCKGAYEEEHSSGGLAGIVKTTDTTIDTTVNQALTVTVEWSAASVNNTITAQIATVTIKN